MPHQIQLPGKILIGNGKIKTLPEVCSDLGVIGKEGKVLIITDENVLKLTGNKIKEILSGHKAETAIIKGATVSEARRIVSEFNDINCIVATGGGTVNDIGKYVAFEKKLPLISVPTALSHDGLASENVSLWDNNGKLSMPAKPPTVIIADIDILKSSPYRLMAAGCADLISNYTAIYDWKLAKRAKREHYSESSAKLAIYSAEAVVKSAKSIKNREEEGVKTLVKALVSSGVAMSLVGSSRPASGSEHKFSHALDSLGSKALHGEQCGLGAILMACHQGQNWQKIKSSLKSVGAPTTAKEIGIEEEMIIQALLKATSMNDRYTILEHKPLDNIKAMELCVTTGMFQ